jgi:Tol biopolymer transport system component
MPLRRRIADAVNFDPYGRRNPAWSYDGRYVAYIDINYVLRVMRADGSHVRKLAPTAFGFSWSPSADALAFDDGSHIYVGKTGATPREILDGRGVQWRADGRLIYRSTSLYDLHVRSARADGTEQETLANNCLFPLLSPDRKLIACSGTGAAIGSTQPLIVMTAWGENRRVLYAGGSDGEFVLAWAPDSRRLAFFQHFSEPLKIVDLGGHARVVVRHPWRGGGNGVNDRVAWSNDGSMLAFSAYRCTGDCGGHGGSFPLRISVVRPDGTGLRILLHGDSVQSDYGLNLAQWERVNRLKGWLP